MSAFYALITPPHLHFASPRAKQHVEDKRAMINEKPKKLQKQRQLKLNLAHFRRHRRLHLARATSL